MTPEQLEALRYSKDGHNILITGQCGTGKTYALKQIIHELKKLKKVAVTSTTGVASHQLGVGATTLHHWSGVKDGRMTTDELKQTYLSDEQFHDARQRILSTETLIIDEVGMLSQLMFEKVELVCRIVKNPHLYFGGLQVIASGDFKQLPPVPNYRYSDTGEYCFSSEAFSKMFPHHFNFKMVVRQNEQQLVAAVNQLCNGSPSPETEEFLKSLDRPLPNVNEHGDNNIVKYLFGTNFDAEYMNIEKLDENIQGAATYLKSVDSGKTTLLQDCSAQRILTLKNSAPVMLIRNVSQGLYNGMIGRVYSIEEDKVVVNFDGRLVNIQRVAFEVYDPSSKKVLATRVQFPLRLAYAMTVHRAQGQSLPLVEVDCYSFFSPGQMGVAIGRAMTIQGLRVVNYNSIAAKLKHKEDVYNFYDQESSQPLQNLNCCKPVYDMQLAEEIDFDFDDFDDDVEINCIEYDDGAFSDENDNSENLIQDHAELNCPFPISTFLESYNGADNLKDIEPKLQSLMKHHYSIIKEILKKQPKSSADFTTIFKAVNKYLISQSHSEIYHHVLGNIKIDGNRVSTSLFRWIIHQEIQVRSDQILSAKQEELTTNENNIKESSAAGLSKVRYLAGACIFHSVKLLKATVVNKLIKKGKNSRLDRQLAFKKQQLLSKLRVSEEEITSNSRLQESLTEIKMRQGEGKNLFHVSDDVFNFFCSLNKKVQCHLSNAAFHCYGTKMIHRKCKLAVKSDEMLIKEWSDLFIAVDGPNNDDSENALEVFMIILLELFDMISLYFIKVALSNALKRFKATIPKTKKQALRPKVQALSESKPTKNKRKFSDIETVSSEPIFTCPSCKKTIEENPERDEDQSIGCDFCNEWFHYKCVSLRGNENCLIKENVKWKCPKCKENTRKKNK